MAKYCGANCRICRREGCKLFLKGARCTTKCPFDKQTGATIPGQHGATQRRRPRLTGYGLQLREKQKVKKAYGLLEKQFKKYYIEAERQKGVTGETMLSLIERRLDNVVYRMGIGVSRAQSRQIVNHGHITVNGKSVNIPSYLVKKGDVIAIKEGSKDLEMFKQIKEGVEPYNVFVNAGVQKRTNDTCVAFVGPKSKGELIYDDNSKVHKVIVMHGAQVNIVTRNYAVVRLINIGNNEVRKHRDKTSLILE